MDKDIELKEFLASIKFDKDEWEWYVLNQKNLNAKAQARWMFATHPKMAAEWEDKTASIKALPEKVGKKKKNQNDHSKENAKELKKMHKK